VLRAYGTSDPGRVRPSNQDRFAIDEPLGLLIVADGMGGHRAGDVAAMLAVDTVLGYMRSTAGTDEPSWPFGFERSISRDGNRLRTAILFANLRVVESSGRIRDHAGMGTTIVAALVVGGRLSIGHVGDSRLYRVTDRAVRQITRDDSWVAETIARHPDVDPEAFAHRPESRALTNVLGLRACADVHVAEEPIAPGDALLLTTDGVHDLLSERKLGRLIDEYDPAEAPGAIVRCAIARGSRDNCTAVVGYV
jgi:serine/threonine protein phosphatase PrpC